MRENTRGYRRKTVNLHVELVSDELLQSLGGTRAPRQRRSRCLYLQQRRRDPGRPTLDVRLRNRHPAPHPSLKAEFPQVEQPWYADDAGARAKVDEIERFFWRLCKIGPLFGYYPEPTKSILIVRQHNLEEARLRFPAFRVKTGNRYLGGFIAKRKLSMSGSAKRPSFGRKR
jgi:hypothetical protein